jgi:hypothetical protein
MTKQPRRQSICQGSRYDNSDKASTSEETTAANICLNSSTAAKHPPEMTIQRRGGKASARDNDHQSGKVSADGGPSHSQQQSICLKGETEATPAAKHAPE